MSRTSHHDTTQVQQIAALLRQQQQIDFAVLVGSRASGNAHAGSDWDIAIQWSPALDWLSVLGATESLRRGLARVLQIDESQVDLIELRRANLAMRASVAEEGVVLTGSDSTAWAIFLRRTWRELEDFYWERRHAA